MPCSERVFAGCVAARVKKSVSYTTGSPCNSTSSGSTPTRAGSGSLPRQLAQPQMSSFVFDGRKRAMTLGSSRNRLRAVSITFAAASLLLPGGGTARCYRWPALFIRRRERCSTPLVISSITLGVAGAGIRLTSCPSARTARSQTIKSSLIRREVVQPTATCR